MNELTKEEKKFIGDLVEDLQEVPIYQYLLKLDNMRKTFGRVIPYDFMANFFGLTMQQVYDLLSPLMSEEYLHMLFTVTDIRCIRCETAIARLPSQLSLAYLNIPATCPNPSCKARFIIDESCFYSNVIINNKTLHLWDTLINVGRTEPLYRGKE